MSYISNTKDETLRGFGCGSGCGCGPCKSGGNNLNEWYVKDEAEPVARAPQPAQRPGVSPPPQPRLSGWRAPGRTTNTPARFPRSYQYDYSINGVGEAIRKPVLLTHFHIHKALHPGAGLLSDASATVMTAAKMRPNFVAVTDPRRASLQRALTKLVHDKHLSAISPKVNLRIALADLTNGKHHTPIFAGSSAFFPGNTVEVDSLAKILALYGVYQLRFDLNTCAKLNGITKGSMLEIAMVKEWKKAGLTVKPNLSFLFQFVETAGSPVVAKLRRTPAIHGNFEARALIVALGFEYLGSIALQAGLFDETYGGLWLNAAYERPALTWWGSPFPKIPRHSASALAAVTFFALLAQGRLVDQTSSNEISSVLKSKKCMSSGLLDGVKQLPGAPAASPNKCGLVIPRFHEAIHVIREPTPGKRLEYVAAVLSEEPPVVDFVQLGKDLDHLIATHNP